MNVRYQADADLNQVIVTGVLRREPAIDFQTAFAAGLEGVKDPEVLAIAAQQERILVSHDRKTMPLEFAEFIIGKQSSGVIIVSRKLSIEVVIEELLLIWSASSVLILCVLGVILRKLIDVTVVYEKASVPGAFS